MNNNPVPTTVPPPTGVSNTEPARLVGSIVAAVTALIALLVAFGIELTQEQQVAILGVVATIAPVIAGFIIREKVFSPNSTQTLANQVAITGDATIPPPPANNV